MSELAATYGEIATRTPATIAIEINSIKDQAKRILLSSSIEIGRRLVEAKTMIPHGEWGIWLEKSVDYSQSTANNLMKIFQEYGADQISIFGAEPKSQALGNLSYTQAVALLGIPAEEREQFVEENDLDSMTTRELQQAIKDRDQAIKEKVEIEKRLDNTREVNAQISETLQKERQTKETLSASYDRLEKTNHEHYETAKRLKKELEDAKASGNTNQTTFLQEQLEQAEGELANSLKKIEDLERQLKEPVEVTTASEIIEKVPEEVERELEALRAKTRELEAKAEKPQSPADRKFRMQFELLGKVFGDLLGSLGDVEDPEAREKYKHAVLGLIGKMEERL